MDALEEFPCFDKISWFSSVSPLLLTIISSLKYNFLGSQWHKATWSKFLKSWIDILSEVYKRKWEKETIRAWMTAEHKFFPYYLENVNFFSRRHGKFCSFRSLSSDVKVSIASYYSRRRNIIIIIVARRITVADVVVGNYKLQNWVALES